MYLSRFKWVVRRFTVVGAALLGDVGEVGPGSGSQELKTDVLVVRI